MVAEMRAERAEADSRRHFTPEKQAIELVRPLLADLTGVHETEDPQIVVARTAGAFRQGAADDLFEVG